MNAQDKLQRRLEQERTTTRLQRQQLKDYEKQILEKDTIIAQLREIIAASLGEGALSQPKSQSQESQDLSLAACHDEQPATESQLSQAACSTPLQSMTNTPKRQCPTGPIRRTCDPDAVGRRHFWSPYLSSPSAPSRIRADPRPFEVSSPHPNCLDAYPDESYPFEEVVRARHERAKLTGSTCPCCAPFFASDKTYEDEDGPLTSAEQVQRFSRHRHRFSRARTPPGFWDLGFPSSEPDHE